MVWNSSSLCYPRFLRCSCCYCCEVTMKSDACLEITWCLTCLQTTLATIHQAWASSGSKTDNESCWRNQVSSLDDWPCSTCAIGTQHCAVKSHTAPGAEANQVISHQHPRRATDSSWAACDDGSKTSHRQHPFTYQGAFVLTQFADSEQFFTADREERDLNLNQQWWSTTDASDQALGGDAPATAESSFPCHECCGPFV